MDKYEVLKQTFGYTSFREGQERLVDSTLSGRDVRLREPGNPSVFRFRL